MGKETKKERERRERDRQRQTDRQTDRQRERKRERERSKKTILRREISTFWKNTEVNRLAPSVFWRMKAPVNKTNAAHRPRFWIPIFQATCPGELGGYGGQ